MYQRNSQRPAKSPTESRPQPSFGPCSSTKAIVRRSKEEPNRRESATLRSSAIFMLVADTGSGGFVFELGVNVRNLGDRFFEKAPVDRILARLLLDVAHRHDRIDTVQDEVRLSSLIDLRR